MTATASLQQGVERSNQLIGEQRRKTEIKRKIFFFFFPDHKIKLSEGLWVTKKNPKLQAAVCSGTFSLQEVSVADPLLLLMKAWRKAVRPLTYIFSLLKNPI